MPVKVVTKIRNHITGEKREGIFQQGFLISNFDDAEDVWKDLKTNAQYPTKEWDEMT